MARLVDLGKGWPPGPSASTVCLVLASFACACGKGAGSSPATPPPLSVASPPPSAALVRIRTALPRFRAAFGEPREPLPAGVLQVYRALGRGELPRARALAQQELTAHPEEDAAALAAGTTLYLSSAFDSAAQLFAQVLEHGPVFSGCERVFYLYGVCLMRLGDGEAARAALGAHLEFAPGDPDTESALGELALQDGNAEAALEHYGKALQAYRAAGGEDRPGLRPPLARVHAGLGRALFQQERLGEAEEAFETSLRLNPRQPPVQYALSRVRLRRGDREGAERVLRSFQDSRPAR